MRRPTVKGLIGKSNHHEIHDACFESVFFATTGARIASDVDRTPLDEIGNSPRGVPQQASAVTWIERPGRIASSSDR